MTPCSTLTRCPRCAHVGGCLHPTGRVCSHEGHVGSCSPTLDRGHAVVPLYSSFVSPFSSLSSLSFSLSSLSFSSLSSLSFSLSSLFSSLSSLSFPLSFSLLSPHLPFQPLPQLCIQPGAEQPAGQGRRDCKKGPQLAEMCSLCHSRTWSVHSLISQTISIRS